MEVYQRPSKTYFQEQKDLESLINSSNLVKKLLPKQADIDKILKVNWRKVLKDMHSSMTVKEIQEGYLSSSYFKDIYLYLAQNRLPSSKAAIRKVEMPAKNIYLIRFIIVQGNIHPRKRDGSLSHTRNMCR